MDFLRYAGLQLAWAYSLWKAKRVKQLPWAEGTWPSDEFIAMDMFMRAGKSPKPDLATTRQQTAGVQYLARGKPGHEVHHAGVRCLEWVGVGKTILQFHGGGFIAGSPESHTGYSYELHKATGYTVISVDYRLAPEHPMPAGLEDCVKVYKELVTAKGIDPQQIAFTGDSAGGGMALLVLQTLKQEGVPLPSCAVLLSPWTDLALDTKEKGNEDRDCMISMAALQLFGSMAVANRDAKGNVIGSNDLKDPRFSPLYGSFEGLPPMYFIVGDTEIMLPDTLLAVKKAEEAGVEVRLWNAKNMLHVFPIFTGCYPEAGHAIGRIAEYMESH